MIVQTIELNIAFGVVGDRLLLEISLLEKISSTDIFFFWVEKYFVVVFITVFFPPPFLFFGNDFISMDQTIPFYGSNSSVVFFSFF